MNLNQYFDPDWEKKIKQRIKEEKERDKKLRESVAKMRKQEVNFPGFDGKMEELIDGIRTIPNYQLVKGYIREKILPNNPHITYRELALNTNVHPGVALVIMYDLYNDKLEQELTEMEEDQAVSH